MLGKLLKYDLKWVYKLVVVYYGLAIIFALVGRGLSFIDNSFIFEFISKFSCGVSVAMVFNILINNIIRLWVRYINNIYKDESYLTHTLPVKKEEIYLSKVLTAVITMFTSIVVVAISLYICYWSNDLIDFIKMLLPGFSWSVVILTIFVLIFEFMFLIFLGYLAITIGYRSNQGKLVKSFLSGFIIYAVSSFMSLLILFIVGLFNSNILDLFKTANPIVSVDILNFILLIALVLYLVYIVLCNVISCKLLTRGVNVD